MLFKVEIANWSHYKYDKKRPYLIRYETTPDISKGHGNMIFHQSRFSSLNKARKVADDLSKFFTDCYLYLDLVYTKLKQLEIAVNISEKYLQLDFNDLEKSRVKLLNNSVGQIEAYKHIDDFNYHISLLKKFCFNISKEYYSTANLIFQQLLSFEDHFRNLYRSAQQLSETNSLRLFQ